MLTKHFVKRAMLWGIIFLIPAIITAITLDTMTEKPFILIFFVIADIIFAFHVKKIHVRGKTTYELKTAIIKGAFTFLAFIIIPLGYYVYIVLNIQKSLGVALIIGTICPLLFLFITAIAENFYFEQETDEACPHCQTITQLGSSSQSNFQTSYYTTTETKTEKVGSIYSNDYTKKADVYSDVTQTTLHAETSYNYKNSYRCPNCGYMWTKKGTIYKTK